ncbi:GNAT family N-acetyltransferase [Cellulomonas fimi]|uniref:GNAT family N-acetyltransferase n=1 Tax=Cellulomonas fimi TaxID=1708 RepID=UPI001B884822|nr:GNAT family N-acetyltransferase [Cellulomonas fimi]
MPERVIRTATTDEDVAAAGALTAEAYLVDGLISDDDEYLDELLDAARRAQEATLLVALLPALAGAGDDGDDGADGDAESARHRATEPGPDDGVDRLVAEGLTAPGGSVPGRVAGGGSGGSGSAPEDSAHAGSAPEDSAHAGWTHESSARVSSARASGARPSSVRAAGGVRSASRGRRSLLVGTPTVVGTITLAPAGTSYAEVAEPGEIEVRMLAVAPEARRRGIAEALTRAAMLEAVTSGADRLVLSTLDAMAGAHRLYERLGFVRAPDRDWRHEGVGLRVYVWDVPTGPGARVETAMWRAREVRDVEGWRVGLSGGFTRRANSVVALAEPDDVHRAIKGVERLYAAAGQASVFRVCRDARPEDLDELLEARGYRDVSHTIVMVRDELSSLLAAVDRGSERNGDGAGSRARGRGSERNGDGPTGAVSDTRSVEPSFVLTEEPDARWLSAWLAVKVSAHAVDHDLAAAVLSGTAALYVAAELDGRIVAVIRAALQDDWAGLSCLMVQPEARRRGIGRALTLEALRHAVDRGATRAFLQVEQSNDSALALYGRLGFSPAERYHYRER